MEEEENAYRNFVGKTKEKDVLEKEGIGDRITLKSILRGRNGERGLNSSGSELGGVANTCESGNEISGSIKRRKYLDRM
jgi:hypothetical protein